MPGYSFIVFAHAALGAIALMAFWSAALMKKGSPRHRAVGKGFLLAMIGIMITGVPLVIERLFFRDQPVGALFLAYLLTITSQACWLAWRAVTDKHDWRQLVARMGWRTNFWLPLLMALLVLAVGAWHGEALLIGFSAVGFFTSFGMWRFAKGGPERTKWHVVMHYQAMLGAGVATHIAFLSIGMRPVLRWLQTQGGVPQSVTFLIPWFAPLLVAIIANVWLNRRYQRGGKNQTSPSSAQPSPVPRVIASSSSNTVPAAMASCDARRS